MASRTALVATIALAAACGHDAAPPDAVGFLCSEQVAADPTFANVQRLFSGICTTCHGPQVELDLAPGVSYANLINRPPPRYATPPTDESCGGVLVKPGDAMASYLYEKVSSAPCAGSQMPLTDLGVTSPLAPCLQRLIRDWITAGAPNN